VDSALWKQPVTYGAIGATQAADLLKHPPEGFRATESRRRIGHGEQRWHFAWLQTMSWGIKKRSGFRVRPADAPMGVLDGEPEYAPDGSQLVRPGDSAMLSLGWGRLSIHEPVRVLYVVDEPRRRGFAYGTLAGHPLQGEELFTVERRDDDSVWVAIRSFSRPSSRLWWALYPAVRLAQALFTRRYLRALAGPMDSTEPG
jgi:uncharacterized protein (UPF0548 family)